LTAMRCPKCPGGAALAALVIDELEVDRCALCGGVWFDKAELAPLLGRDTGRVGAILGGDGAATDPRTGTCPRDARRLHRVKSARNSSVTIETCTICQGIWLDGGEFESIKRVKPGLRLGDLI
jgi:Zn-finger nucleic acid-binding protein